MTFILRNAAPPCKSLSVSCFPDGASSHSHTGPFLELPLALLEMLWPCGWKALIALRNFMRLVVIHTASRNVSCAAGGWANHRSSWSALLHLELGRPSLKGGIAIKSSLESMCHWISINCINCSSLPLALL